MASPLLPPVLDMEPSQTAGYSGTPLARKLGIREGTTVLLVGAPEDYVSSLEPLPPAVTFKAQADRSIDLAQVFVTRRDELARLLTSLRRKLRPDAAVWVSWPKKSARLATDVTEDTIRELALPLGFVDIKVCAVSNVWSGLKLVVRRELR